MSTDQNKELTKIGLLIIGSIVFVFHLSLTITSISLHFENQEAKNNFTEASSTEDAVICFYIISYWNGWGMLSLICNTFFTTILFALIVFTIIQSYDNSFPLWISFFLLHGFFSPIWTLVCMFFDVGFDSTHDCYLPELPHFQAFISGVSSNPSLYSCLFWF